MEAIAAGVRYAKRRGVLRAGLTDPLRGERHMNSLATPTNNQFAKWARTRGHGLLRFVLVQGMLLWGVGTAILFSLFESLVCGYKMSDCLSVSIVIFPLGGVAWGVAMWFVMESKYKKQIASGGS